MPIFLATLATSHAIVAPTPPVPPEQASHVLLAIEEYRALAEAASKAAPPRSGNSSSRNRRWSGWRK